MKTWLLIIPFFLAFFIIAGCGEDPSEYDLKADGRVIGSVHGVVTDANTNARLEAIEVTWAVKGSIKSTTTDQLGYYSIAKLPSGNFELSFSGDGAYAVTRVTALIPTLEQIGAVTIPSEDDYHHSETQDVNLYRLNAGLTGTVYAHQDSENIITAAGVTVISDFESYDISPDKYSAVTNTDGVFLIEDLPATPFVSLRTMPYNDGSHEYGVHSDTATLEPGSVAKVGDIILYIAPAVPFLVQNNFLNDDFGITENIVATFSKAMATSTFDIALSSFSFGDVEFAATWNTDITLTLDPYVPLQANTTYSLTLNGKSMDNNDFSGNYNFDTQEGIEFVRTNLERVDGIFDQFPVASDIELIFSMPIDLGNYNGYVRLYDAAFERVSITTTFSTDSLTVSINSRNDLEPGLDYTLDYKVYSTIEGDFDNNNINFQTAVDIAAPEQITGFSLDRDQLGGSWTADWNTTDIAFKWNTVADCDGYRIYANDNRNNSDIILVASINVADYVIEQSTWVFLSSFPQFDYFADDGIQTPFTGGTQISFQITAYNTAGEGQFSSTINVADNTAPTGILIQSGSALNPSALDTQTFTVVFIASEYCDPTEPTFGFVESGGDPNYVLPSNAVSFEWDTDMKGGLYTITVPATEDGSGDNFFISNFNDSSGNTAESSFTIALF